MKDAACIPSEQYQDEASPDAGNPINPAKKISAWTLKIAVDSQYCIL